MKDRLIGRVYSYYECVDENDVPSLLDLFSENVTYHRPGYPPLMGRKRLAKFYMEERVIRRGKHVVDEIVADDNRVAVHGNFRGVLHSGESVELRFADFFVAADDGAFIRRDTFFFKAAV